MNKTRRQFMTQSAGIAGLVCSGGLLSLTNAKTPEAQTIVSTHVNPPTKDVILDVTFENKDNKPDNTWYIGLMCNDIAQPVPEYHFENMCMNLPYSPWV